MIDIQRIRDDADGVVRALAKRDYPVNFTELLRWDADCRATIKEVEDLRARRNTVSAEIPQLKKQGKDVSALLDEMKQVGDRIKGLDETRSALESKIKDFLDRLPNLPDEDVVAGGKEANKVMRSFGSKPSFSFAPKDHVQLATDLGLIDYERGVKLGGTGFWVYTGDGALLEWALLNYFIEENSKAGFELHLLPHILTHQSGYTAGQFPKFEEDVFLMHGSDRGHFLLPTAETALVNLHRDEVLKEEDLPKRYCGYTPCYRKEAGSYRASERGMIRGHQFNKLELFAYCTPAQSDALHEEMIGRAEALMQGLGLHYQLSKLAAGDTGPAMAKTYDIEVWIPSMNEYKEVSSSSNVRDYQARRGEMRFKPRGGGKNQLMHTLNASGLATSRLFPAILEQFQQADGSVQVPRVLNKWFPKQVISPRG